MDGIEDLAASLEPTSAAPVPGKVVGQQLARIVEELPAGLYRSQMTVCRIRLGADGLEAGAEVVLLHAADFTIAPPALAPSEGAAP
jgi:hypothetical protein